MSDFGGIVFFIRGAPLTTQTPNPSIQSLISIASGCSEAIDRLLITNCDLDTVKVIPFSTGTHWVSTPLKVVGKVGNEERVYLAKAMTDEGLHTHQDIFTNKNARFARNDIVDISFDGSASAYELLQHEARFLKAAKRASIFVPTALGVFELTCVACSRCWGIRTSIQQQFTCSLMTRTCRTCMQTCFFSGLAQLFYTGT